MIYHYKVTITFPPEINGDGAKIQDLTFWFAFRDVPPVEGKILKVRPDNPSISSSLVDFFGGKTIDATISLKSKDKLSPQSNKFRFCIKRDKTISWARLWNGLGGPLGIGEGKLLQLLAEELDTPLEFLPANRKADSSSEPEPCRSSTANSADTPSGDIPSEVGKLEIPKPASQTHRESVKPLNPDTSPFVTHQLYFKDSGLEDAETIYFLLRHEKFTDRWLGAYCPKFSNILPFLRNFLEDGKAYLEEPLQKDYETAYAFLQKLDAKDEIADDDFDIIPQLVKIFNWLWCQSDEFGDMGISFEGKVREIYTYTIDEQKHPSLTKENADLKNCFTRLAGKIPPYDNHYDDKLNGERWAAQLHDLFCREYPQFEDVVDFQYVERAEGMGDDLFGFVNLITYPGTIAELKCQSKQSMSIQSITLAIVLSNGKSLKYLWNNKGMTTDAEHYELQSETALSLSDYQELKRDDAFQWKATIQFIPASKGELAVKEYSSTDKNDVFHFIRLPKSPRGEAAETYYVSSSNETYSLFMDMGSVNTKFLLIPRKENDKLRYDNAEAYGHPTEKFIEEFGIFLPEGCQNSFQCKEKMKGAPERYAAFLVSAIHSVAEKFRQKGKILEAVCWAFPNINEESGFFPKVEELVKPNISDCVLLPDHFLLVPEHEALGKMYSEMLQNLTCHVGKFVKDTFATEEEQINNQTNRNLAEINEKIRRQEEEDKKRWVIGRILKRIGDSLGRTKLSAARKEKNDIKTNATKEKSSLGRKILKKNSWLKEALKFLVCCSVNSNSFLMDLGGYSVDMYCPSDEKLRYSMECSGEALRQLFCENVNKKRKEKRQPELDEKEAMGMLAGQKPMDEEDSEALHDATETIYGGIYELLEKHNKSYWHYLVLSGGASGNGCFRAGLQKKLPKISVSSKNNPWLSSGIVKKLLEVIDNVQCDHSTETWTIPVPVVTAKEIYHLIETMTGGRFQEEDWMSRFAAVVTKNVNGVPQPDNDIVGGMLAIYLEKYKM